MKKWHYIIFVLLLTADINATTYFVRNGGNDSNSGRDSVNAWATMHKISATLVSNDTCYIYGGVYGPTGADGQNNFSVGNGSPTVYSNLAPQNSGADEAHRIFIIGLRGSGRTRPLIIGSDSTVTLTPSTTMRNVCFVGGGRHHITFQNLEFAYSYKGVMISNATDITFVDCKSSSAYATSGDSNGGAYTLGLFSGGQSRIIFKRCEAAGPLKSIGSNSWVNTSINVGGNNLDGWHLYVTKQSVWDSCFVTDDRGMYAIIGFKTLCYQDTVRYCNFKAGGTMPSIWGIRAGVWSNSSQYWYAGYQNAGQHYIHHNVFNGMGAVLVESGEGYSYTWVVDTIYFYNNTIYNNTDRGYLISSTPMNSGGTPNPPTLDNYANRQYVFNNIWMGTPARAFQSIYPSYFDTVSSIIDNNCYYGSTNAVGRWGTTNTNLSTWQSNSKEDAHSQYIDPALNNPAAGDFTWSATTPNFIKTGGTRVNGFGSTYIGAYGFADTTTGACCLSDYTCGTNYTSAACAAAGGTWQGSGTSTCTNCCQTTATSLVSPITNTLIELISPLSQTGLVKLRWSAVSGASNYHAQIATDSTFANVKLDYTNSSPSWDAGGYDATSGRSLLADSTGTIYFWRVRAYTINCGWSTWTSPWKFILKDSEPPFLDSL
jgi:hypothetical protein